MSGGLNSVMPHFAFDGQTPDEMYWGTGAAVPGAAAPYRADRTDSRAIRIWGDPGLADR